MHKLPNRGCKPEPQKIPSPVTPHPSPLTPHPNSNPATSASRSIKLRVGRDSCKKQQKVS